MYQQPSTILQQAQLITKLQALLAFDLAITLSHKNNQDPTVHLQLQGTRLPVNLFLASSEVEQLVSDLAQQLIETIEGQGVNTTEILDNFKSVGTAVLSQQENKQGVDNGQAL